MPYHLLIVNSTLVKKEVRHKTSLEPRDDLSPVSPYKIQKLVNNLKTKKAPGLDGISDKAIKCFPLTLPPLMVAICNAYLKNCYFPLVWKETEFGFWPNHSCPYQALCVVEYIMEVFKTKKTAVAVFFDIAIGRRLARVIRQRHRAAKLKEAFALTSRGPSMRWFDSSKPGGLDRKSRFDWLFRSKVVIGLHTHKRTNKRTYSRQHAHRTHAHALLAHTHALLEIVRDSRRNICNGVSGAAISHYRQDSYVEQREMRSRPVQGSAPPAPAPAPARRVPDAPLFISAEPHSQLPAAGHALSVRAYSLLLHLIRTHG
ncbi:hypothetical protein EVAR_59392_1 [Eumeta japonica]|uniref:RNA-directed DNA polymerase from mobile element jockey n=1 Tax=Eumeta variegata TaxID=151549 RepID=A0A4C1YMC0_EUMVA|nr:hypothetical protein EVAR_59392_1 [Eumeta japonica]